MSKNQQQMYSDISELTKAITKLIKTLEKIIKYQAND